MKRSTGSSSAEVSRSNSDFPNGHENLKGILEVLLTDSYSIFEITYQSLIQIEMGDDALNVRKVFEGFEPNV
jgi:hypothetical protein